MKIIWALAISTALLAPLAAGQSLGDLARQQREKRAKEQTSTVVITTDDMARGKLDTPSPLDPARKGDLNYLLGQLARPRISPELLRAFIPLKDSAVPKLQGLLESADAMKRVAPATVLTVLGNTEGLATMARLLGDSTRAAASEKTAAPTDAQLEASRTAGYALDATKAGFWRFTEGSALSPGQVVDRLEKGPPLEIVGGVDNGQRLFNRAWHDADPNVRLAAIALIQVASGGDDFGFRADQNAEQNQAAIQKITSFLTTERAKVAASPLALRQK